MDVRLTPSNFMRGEEGLRVVQESAVAAGSTPPASGRKEGATVEVDSGSHGIVLQSTRVVCIVYTPSREYLTAISRGSVLIIEAGSMEVVYSCQLLDFEFERKFKCFDGIAGIHVTTYCMWAA